MHTSGITLAVVAISATALMAQQAPPPEKLFSSSSDVAALMAEAKAEHKDQALITKRILNLAPYNANLEYRSAVANAAVHETEAEMFYVIDGSATLVTGGKLKDEKRTNAENLSGSGIENGNARDIAKGDFVMVPQGTPHWFSKINGTLVLMSIHLPRK